MTKNITKKIQILLIIFIILLFNQGVFAEPVRVLINDHHLVVPVDPIIENDRTLVPLRAIFEVLGAEVLWDGSTRTVTGTRDNNIIKLQIDNKVATINGEPVELEVPARIVDDSTLVPIRFISESLGALVNWDNITRTVLIKSDYNVKTYKVVRVVDGDTIKVLFNGKEESLRLIGIDTPESVHPNTDKNSPEGIMASNYTKSQLEGKQVVLEFDVQERDQYGRLLAYVWLGNNMFNKTLLEEGYALVSTYPPNVRYVNDFLALERIARENDKGLWQYEEVKVNPETAAFIGSKRSDKYHYVSYTHSGQIAAHNLIYFESLDHAIANGYKPCGICFR